MIFDFFRKRVETPLETYEQRLIKLEREVSKHRVDILDLYTDMDSMRDKVLRKIQTRKTKETEETETEDLKTKMLIPE